MNFNKTVATADMVGRRVGGVVSWHGRQGRRKMGSEKMERSRIWSFAAAAGGILGLVGAALPALAQDQGVPVLGAPHEGGIGLQPPATELAENMDFLHNVVLMPIITVITLFVLALLLIIFVKFRESKNPVPSKNT